MLGILLAFGKCFQQSITSESCTNEGKKALENDQCQMSNAKRIPNAKRERRGAWLSDLDFEDSGFIRHLSFVI